MSEMILITKLVKPGTYPGIEARLLIGKEVNSISISQFNGREAPLLSGEEADAVIIEASRTQELIDALTHLQDEFLAG